MEMEREKVGSVNKLIEHKLTKLYFFNTYNNIIVSSNIIPSYNMVKSLKISPFQIIRLLFGFNFSISIIYYSFYSDSANFYNNYNVQQIHQVWS